MMWVSCRRRIKSPINGHLATTAVSVITPTLTLFILPGALRPPLYWPGNPLTNWEERLLGRVREFPN